MEQLIVGLIALVIGICATILWTEIKDQRVRTEAIEKRAEEMHKRIQKLEVANRKRMPNEAMDDILNGMAALDALESEADFRKETITNAKAHFSKALTIGTNREEK